MVPNRIAVRNRDVRLAPLDRGTRPAGVGVAGSREGSAEFSKADLAATYATINRVTAMPAVYVPPPQTQDPATQERWAQVLEAPGGMAEISQDITRAEMGFTNDRKETQSIASAERRQERQERAAAERVGPIPGVSDRM